MSYTLAPIALTEGVTSYVTLPGAGQSVSYIKLTNASPYLVLLSNLTSGQDYLQPGECNVWQVDGLSTAIQATPQVFVTTPNIIPVSLLVATWYLAGEPAPAGTYPVNFNLLQYLGNSVMVNSATNTIEQDLLTPFVLSGLVVSKDGTVPNQIDITAGVAYPRQSDGSLLRQALVAATFLSSVPSTTYYLDLNSDGSWSWGTNHSTQSNYLTIAQATTDASGNIATVNDERNINTVLLASQTGTLTLAAIQGVLFGQAFGAAAASIAYNPAFGLEIRSVVTGASPTGVFFATWNGSADIVPFSVGGQVASALGWIDTAGVLHAPAPVTLAAGNQETGACGFDWVASGANDLRGYVVNFKTRMTNSPSSVTLTVASSSNVKVGTPTASSITRDGFLFFLEAAAAGSCNWIGAYTTVGN